jgi:transcriptional regulator with XRE-family HTH domain
MTAIPEEHVVQHFDEDDAIIHRRLIFGENVRHYRQNLSLSQEQLAVAAGVDRKTINRIEQGVHSARLDNVWLIAEALGVDVRDLFVE